MDGDVTLTRLPSTTQVRKVSPVDESMQYAAKEVGLLIDLVGALGSRLQPVLGLSEQNEDSLPSTPEQPPNVASKIGSMASAVGRQNSRIRDLLERLEI